MAAAPVRPRIELHSPRSLNDISVRFARALREPDCPVSGLVAASRIELHAHGRDQHFWSPQLVVDLEPGDSGTVLRGRFGPHPSVWTMYVGGYAAIGFGSLGGLSYAAAQFALGSPPWALLSLPVAGVALGLLYASALVGQDLSRSQIDELSDFLSVILEGEVESSSEVSAEFV